MFRGSDFPHWRNNEPLQETGLSLSARCSSSLLDDYKQRQKLGRITTTRSYFRSDAATDDDQQQPVGDRPKRPSPSNNDAMVIKTMDLHNKTKKSGTVTLLKPVVEKAKKEIKYQQPEIDFVPSHHQRSRCASTTTAAGVDITLPPLDLQCQKRRNGDEDDVSKPNQPKRWHRTMVDVMPDFQVPLIGVKESLDAYRSDRCVHTRCYECDTFLYCIATADLVLCPHCKAISPTDKHIPILIENSVILGLGLTADHVLNDPDGLDGHF